MSRTYTMSNELCPLITLFSFSSNDVSEILNILQSAGFSRKSVQPVRPAPAYANTYKIVYCDAKKSKLEIISNSDYIDELRAFYPRDIISYTSSETMPSQDTLVVNSDVIDDVIEHLDVLGYKPAF